MTESNLTVMKCKFEMCNILEIVMNIQNDIRITRFLREFNDRISHESENDSVVSNRKLSKRSKSFRNSQNTIGNKLERLIKRLLEDKKLDLEELSWSDYVCINLDLILYNNENLLNKLLHC